MPKIKHYTVKVKNRKTGHIRTITGRAKSPSNLARRHGFSGKKYQITDFKSR